MVVCATPLCLWGYRWFLRLSSRERNIFSKPARTLCSLLFQWPRRQVQSWLDAGSDLSTLSYRDLGPKRAKPLARFLAAAEAEKVMAICLLDETFPELLRQIPDPPLLLFYDGNLALLQRPSIAVVGSRRATHAGRRLAYLLGQELGVLGAVVVSGLAIGIDTAGHQGALSHDDGATIGVLGSSLDDLYPSRNRGLAAQVVSSQGLLISEYPPGTPPRRFFFRERNRIVSGLAQATVVVEAGVRSGALITARLALEQGREVAVFPGSSLTGANAGGHALIRQGAALVESAADVFQELGWSAAARHNPQLGSSPTSATASETTVPATMPHLSAGALKLLPWLGVEALNSDALIQLSGMAISDLSLALVELQLAGIVRQHGGGYIRL